MTKSHFRLCAFGAAALAACLVWVVIEEQAYMSRLRVRANAQGIATYAYDYSKKFGTLPADVPPAWRDACADDGISVCVRHVADTQCVFADIEYWPEGDECGTHIRVRRRGCEDFGRQANDMLNGQFSWPSSEMGK